MINIKPLIVLLSLLFVMILMVPTLLVLPFADKGSGKLTEELDAKHLQPLKIGPDMNVAVYRSELKEIVEIPIEEYVVGVVSAEMGPQFELEALKAQALAARTYVVKQMLAGKSISAPEGAHVTDTVLDQVYKSREQLRAGWGAEFAPRIAKVAEAVEATAGKVITFNNEPIDASFFSTSNGFTENSEEYWQNEYPYLRSVESPWDEVSPAFTDKKVVTLAEFQHELGVTLPADGSVGKIVSRTTGDRVGEVEINGKKLKGREVREKLELRSSDFTWERSGNEIIITTKGYGHGVGMSQYGANGMAKLGSTHEQILTHYYQGVQIASADQYMNKLTAKSN
ncbi:MULTISPECIES: stage II sporulation protein D [Bacillus]|uniref:stage II sporulation protein D n=1 Tax=Bacillus TaxID=1386 RepID=UPI000BB9B591|nr:MULTISPECIES: stage II sporulation protein D [Bacillus]